MSGIYIPNMEMPKNEPMLVKINPDGSVSTTAKNNYRKYEAIPVPDHGRLGDLDELKKKAEWANTDDDTDVRVVRLDSIDEAPTIIEAEEEE